MNRKWTNPGAEETRIRPFQAPDIPQVEREFTVHKGTVVAYSLDFERPNIKE